MMLRKLRDVLYKGTDEFSWDYAEDGVPRSVSLESGCVLFWSSSTFFGIGTFSPNIIKGLGLVSLL